MTSNIRHNSEFKCDEGRKVAQNQFFRSCTAIMGRFCSLSKQKQQLKKKMWRKREIIRDEATIFPVENM